MVDDRLRKNGASPAKRINGVNVAIQAKNTKAGRDQPNRTTAIERAIGAGLRHSGMASSVNVSMLCHVRCILALPRTFARNLPIARDPAFTEKMIVFSAILARYTVATSPPRDVKVEHGD